MMFDIHRRGSDGKIVAVADIGSGSAGFCILAVNPGKPALVLSAERALLPIEERAREATVAGIGEQLSKAIEDCLKSYAAQMPKGVKPVEELYVVMRAPWSRSKTTQARSQFEQETIVTDQLIARAAQQAIANEQEFDRKNFLEASVVRVELNGYPTGEPRKKHARQLSVSALVSVCDPDIRAEVTGVLQAHFPGLSPVFRSSTRAFLSVLSERGNSDKDYLIVDMASEGTTLVVVREGIAVDHYLVPEGVRAIVKRVAPVGMPEETLSLIRMLAEDQCSTQACEAISASMARAEPELVRVFGEGMAKCAATRRLPNRLVLIAHPDVLAWLGKFFSRIDFTQFTLTTQPFSVEMLSMRDLAQFALPQGKAMLDTGLALVSSLVNIEESRV